MEKFKKIESNAIPLPMVNVDTDMIIPKQFLKTIKRTGLGKNLFYELRYDEKDAPIDSFVLNHCLLYTSPSPRDMRRSRMPSSA